MKRYILILCLLLSGLYAHAQKRTYEYDELQRLKKTHYWKDGSVTTTVTYNYDAVGNRESKIITVYCGLILQTVKSGLWNDATVWDCGTLPTLTKDIRINSPHVITLPAGYTATAKSVEVQGQIQYNANAKIQLGQ